MTVLPVIASFQQDEAPAAGDERRKGVGLEAGADFFPLLVEIAIDQFLERADGIDVELSQEERQDQVIGEGGVEGVGLGRGHAPGQVLDEGALAAPGQAGDEVEGGAGQESLRELARGFEALIQLVTAIGLALVDGLRGEAQWHVDVAKHETSVVVGDPLVVRQQGAGAGSGQVGEALAPVLGPPRWTPAH